MRRQRAHTIALVAPTTIPASRTVWARLAGFLYVVARLASRGKAPRTRGAGPLTRCRSLSDVPRSWVRIGLTTAIDRYRDTGGLVVGSALLEAILGGPDAGAREEARGASQRTSEKSWARKVREPPERAVPAPVDERRICVHPGPEDAGFGAPHVQGETFSPGLASGLTVQTPHCPHDSTRRGSFVPSGLKRGLRFDSGSRGGLFGRRRP